MPERSVVHSTFVLERSYPKPPEAVFAAFSDAAKKRRWFIDGEHHEVEKFEIDFRVGGAERARYRMLPGTPISGKVLENEGIYVDIAPNRRIVMTSAMSLEGRTFSASLITIELLPTSRGTDLICTHQGAFLEGADGPKIREAGWRALFDKLGQEISR